MKNLSTVLIFKIGITAVFWFRKGVDGDKGGQLHAYALMTNHVDLLVTPS